MNNINDINLINDWHNNISLFNAINNENQMQQLKKYLLEKENILKIQNLDICVLLKSDFVINTVLEWLQLNKIDDCNKYKNIDYKNFRKITEKLEKFLLFETPATHYNFDIGLKNYTKVINQLQRLNGKFDMWENPQEYEKNNIKQFNLNFEKKSISPTI